jgi:hypothetical protein
MKPVIICLTPVKNEAWILDRFLQATSLWADYIIIADQMSTDGSREIALKYAKVVLVDNKSDSFNEPERQKLLIHEARKIPGKRLLITLDADELFTPNILNSLEWNKILDSEPGTVFKFQWANLCQDFKTFWYANYFPWGFMDNGFEHNANDKIHTTRIPLPADAESMEIKDIKVMHLQYTNWQRMQSKHRWYQCYEHVTFPDKSPVTIFRKYHHMYAIDKESLNKIPDFWISGYNNMGIDIKEQNDNGIYWWDEKVLDYFDQYGIDYFTKIYLWNVNWNEISKIWKRNNLEYDDPRNFIDRLIHIFLFHTQSKRNNYIVHKFENQFKKRFSY